jgi:hypothetical protein
MMAHAQGGSARIGARPTSKLRMPRPGPVAAVLQRHDRFVIDMITLQQAWRRCAANPS